ncbi:MAG: flagellar biosynthesis anti-sigma factor FlgM [Thermodesulfobacteriota bacterium]|nr:flagellar biosynthesis anti-sigma factor FlgM [Thermodesulfobacteriota bacterium]
MKVNEYNLEPKINSYGQTKAATDETKAKVSESQASQPKSGDKVDLSDRSREIARARELVEAAPAVRADKVAAMKAQLNSGDYEVKAEEVADKIIFTQVEETV